MNDLISRHAVRLIESDSDAYPEVWNHDYERGFTDAIIRVIGLPSVNQWIPCSERLPDEENVYLVTFEKSCLLDNEIQVTNALWIDNQWQYDVLESYEHKMPKLVIEPIEELKVIAWMSLPEPYKGEES